MRREQSWGPDHVTYDNEIYMDDMMEKMIHLEEKTTQDESTIKQLQEKLEENAKLLAFFQGKMLGL